MPLKKVGWHFHTKIRKKELINVYWNRWIQKQKKSQYNSTCSFLHIMLSLGWVIGSFFQRCDICIFKWSENIFWEQIVSWILTAGWPLAKQWSGKEGPPLGTEEIQFDRKYPGIHCVLTVQLNRVWDHCQMPCTCCHLPTSPRCYLVLTINLFKYK